MSLETSLQSLLDPLAAGGAFQDFAGHAPGTSYIVWQQIVSTTNNTFSGASDVQNTRIQIDIYGSTPAERKGVADAVIAAMSAASFRNVQLSSQNFFESEVRLYRTMLEFSAWSAG